MIRFLAWLLIGLDIGLNPVVNELDTVEVNTFGDHARTSVIYRLESGEIVAWRWLRKPGAMAAPWETTAPVPELVEPGKYLAAWREQGSKLVIVRCRQVTYTRTLRDVEVEERAKLPDERRRKLVAN